MYILTLFLFLKLYTWNAQEGHGTVGANPKEGHKIDKSTDVIPL